jgi:hypothetical protein
MLAQERELRGLWAWDYLGVYTWEKELELLNLFTASVGVECVGCRLELWQNMHTSQHFFLAPKMEMLPCFGLAMREYLLSAVIMRINERGSLRSTRGWFMATLKLGHLDLAVSEPQSLRVGQ